MSEDSVIKGLKARANAQRGGAQRGGAQGGMGAPTGPLPSNYASGGVMSQYNEWNFGISYGNALPRSWDTFLSGAFGPMAPIQPMGIDAPQTDSGRPEPRRMQYPIAWNMPMGQPGSEGLKLVSFANLRAYADMYSVVRACIQVRKEEILGLDWDITPTDDAARGMRGDLDKHDDFQERRLEALKFFKRPDPNYHDFSGWMSAVLEDVFVVDALALYLHPPRVDGKGVLGSNLAALEVLDGTTIRPMLDIRGGTPRPPDVAYQQYLWGIPRVDMMDIILESDIQEMDDPVDEYRADQLLYLPYTRRSWTPYGFPGIERAIIPVMTGLRRQQFQLDFYSEGTIPGQFIIPGDDISTPQQIRQLQDTLNAIAGDQAWKHKIIVLPRGSDTKPQKPIDLASGFDETITQMICMAYDVMPMELGMSSGSSSSQSSGAASQMAKASQEISQRKALKPMLQWLKNAIFDHILQDIFMQEDMQFVWIGMEDSKDEETMADNFKTMISTGILSIDEARTQMGLNPWGLPLTSDPVYATATGLTTLGAIDPSVADAMLGETVVGEAGANAPQQVTMTENINTDGTESSGPAPAPKPASSAGTPGIGGRPKTDGTPAGVGGGAPSVTQPAKGTSTPLHGNSKKNPKQTKALEIAVTSELDLIRRTLKKGRSLDGWKTEFVSSSVLGKIKKSYEESKDASLAIAIGKAAFRNEQRVLTRKETINEISAHVFDSIQHLASNINNPQIGMIKFIDGSTKILQHGYHATLNAGARDASSMYEKVSAVTPFSFKTIAEARAENQRGYLTGLAQDIISGESDAKIANRLNLYVRSLVPAYEQGFGLAVISGQAIGNSTLGKRGSSAPFTFSNDNLFAQDEPVDDYAALDDMYPEDSMGMTDVVDTTDTSNDGVDLFAGLLGIGMFLDNLLGGDITEADSEDFLNSPNATIIWNAEGEDPCALCIERDGEEYTIETLPCWPGDGGFGEFCEGAANCNCTLEYVEGDQSTTADNPFSTDSVDFYAQRAAEEAAFDQQAIDARAADIAAVAEENPDAAARMAQRDMLYGVPNTNDAYYASEEPSIIKKETGSLEDAAWYYLKSHYKKRAIQWVKEATWTFNNKLNIDDLILMRKPDNIDKDKVAEIKEEFANGRTVHPIVVVKTSEGYEVADGNHRITALKELGIKTVAAYVASGVGDFGPWVTMMQDNSLKKFVAPTQESFVAYKALDPSALAILQVGDVVSDGEMTVFSSAKPVAEAYAIVKYLPSGRLLPGQELIVTDITGNEVTLEIL